MNGKRLALFIILLSLFSFSTSIEASTIVNPKQKYSYSQMEKDIKNLAKKYPDLIQYEVIGKSEYGRNIYAVALGKGNSTVFINGSHHAREWLSTNLNMHMLEQYARAYKSNSTMGGYRVRTVLNETTMWFVPMVNPDGVQLQQFGLSAFPSKDHASIIQMNDGSRDFKRWKANAKGVDLNRQYDADWRNIKNDPGKPKFANYKGTRPHSASETKAIVDFTYRIDPEMTVSYHSSGEILFWNFHQTGSRYNRDLAYAKQIGKLTGYRLIYPGPNPSGGGMTDWFIQEFKRPGFTPELGRYPGQTNLPISEFDRVWKQNRYVGLYVAYEGHKLYLNRLSTVAENEVSKAEREANRLTEFYIITSPKNVRLTPEFERQYDKTRDAISNAASTVRQLPNNAVKRNLQQRLERTIELRRRATLVMRAMNRGELLTERNVELNQSIDKNTLNDKTIAALESVKHELQRTEAAIENVVGVGNRRVISQAYAVPAKETIALIDGAVTKYLALNEVEITLTKDGPEKASTQLKKAASIQISNSSRMKEIAKQLTQRENELHAKIEKAQSNNTKEETPAKQEEVPPKQEEKPKELDNPSNKSGFTDVRDGHPSIEEIVWLSNRNIINGYSDGTFKPSNHITRRQAALMIARAFELDLEKRPNTNFTDVATTLNGYEEIAAVIDEGLFAEFVKGDQFGPNQPLTRAEMATILTNAYQLSSTSTLSHITDIQSHWAEAHITTLVEHNITTGFTDHTFRPESPLTRAHFSVFMARTEEPTFRP
ncbi:M14 family zinc carboxypeptidase [Halalkalibacter alkaliphilus]|uniref:S-layer homology domain-containing protein n=1 Tax=Halalkalibacter alkaliphilus TaxID=2917993 RepID=A0A9X2A2L3_9BACI|nr:M14 family zinc carboxypeptidase [Halalkalibacter alkaliphilus]MCL7746780.1 S-layer homology domain-containing protein [Halalkalibacter alkaliphilus]